MTWILVSIIIMCAGYLTYMIISFLYRLNDLRPKIDRLDEEIEAQEKEADKFEMEALETDRRATELEQEVLRYERRITELQARIKAQEEKKPKPKAYGARSQITLPES